MMPDKIKQKKYSFQLFSCFFILGLLYSGFAQGTTITLTIGSGERGDAIQVNTAPVQINTGTGGSAFLTCKEQVQELGQTGEPNIPWKVFDILLPPDADLATVSCHAQSLKYKTISSLDVGPVLPTATWDRKLNSEVVFWPEKRSIVNGFDAAIYSADAFWPVEAVNVVHVGKLRSFKMAKVAVAMARYNPVTREVRCLTDVNVAVEFNRLTHTASTGTARQDLIGLSRVKEIAANACQYLNDYAYTGPGSLQEPAGYIILTTSVIQNASSELDNFISHKEAKGFTVEVVTESTWGGGTGDNASENIRKWLQENYESKEILYVLLIGNPHPRDGDVPMKFCHERPDSDELHEAPTDMYYSNLSGDWDINNDGYYGTKDDIRTDGVDLHWEVMVGRIPQYRSSDIDVTDIILKRIIDYENEQDIDWRWNALLPWVRMDDRTPNWRCPEQVKDNLLEPKGIGYHRIYGDDFNLSPPPEDYPNGTEKTRDVWRDGKFGYVFWGTHGYAQGGSSVMTSSYARTLDADYPTNTWQYSCSTGYPEESDNVAYELLKAASVSTSGATRSGWYSPGRTDFTNATCEPSMGYQNTKRVVVPGTSIGRAWHDSRQEMVPGMWDNFILHSIYGDPSLVIYDTATTDIKIAEKRLAMSLGLSFYQSRLSYRIPDINNNKQEHVTIRLYNVQGKLIKTLVDERKIPGSYHVSLHDDGKLSAALYVCKMTVREYDKTIKIIIK
jgi:hypothetical protein